MNIQPMVVDLSHYEVVGDWNKVKRAGIVGVINKASEGPGMLDKTFAVRREECAKFGLLYGAYHFLRPYNVPAQVEHFLGVASPDDKMLLALDHEDPKVSLDQAVEFLFRVNQLVGRYPILYSGFLIKEQLEDRHVNNTWCADIRLWLSQYGSSPSWPKEWERPWLWQFTGDGSGPYPHVISGISIPGGKGIDINSYEGTAAQLAKEWANGGSSSSSGQAVV